MDSRGFDSEGREFSSATRSGPRRRGGRRPREAQGVVLQGNRLLARRGSVNRGGPGRVRMRERRGRQGQRRVPPSTPRRAIRHREAPSRCPRLWLGHREGYKEFSS